MSDNIAHLLRDWAARQPRQPAVVFVAGRNRDGGERHPLYSHLTFGGLAARSDALAWGLTAYGFKPGTRSLLMIRPTLDFYALVFALLKIGAVPVLIDPGMGWKGFLRCVRQVAPEAFLGIPQAHLLRLARPGAFRTVRLKVTMGARRFWGGKTIDELIKLADGKGAFECYEPKNADELAAVLFTSGSTGPAKGVSYTHRIFAAQCAIVKRLCAITPGEADLACFPLFSLFSIASGATAVVPEMDATHPAAIDYRNVLEAVRDWQVSYSFGSPALWKHVSEECLKHGERLSGLKRIFMSGAPVPVETHQKLRELMDDGAQTYAPYGCTEALPIAVLDGATVINETAALSAQGRGVCVGPAIPEITVKIIRITDEPIEAWSADLELPVGEIGEICVCGDCVTHHYFGRADADLLSKIAGPAEGQLWHRVGDTGYLDERGRLWFCGRKNHRVVTASGTLYSIPTEAAFNALSGVARSALVGIGEKPQQRAAIILEALPGARLTPAAALSAVGNPSISAAYVYPGSFPVDVRHNAKINREQLAEWAARQNPTV